MDLRNACRANGDVLASRTDRRDISPALPRQGIRVDTRLGLRNGPFAFGIRGERRGIRDKDHAVRKNAVDMHAIRTADANRIPEDVRVRRFEPAGNRSMPHTRRMRADMVNERHDHAVVPRSPDRETTGRRRFSRVDPKVGKAIAGLYASGMTRGRGDGTRHSPRGRGSSPLYTIALRVL